MICRFCPKRPSFGAVYGKRIAFLLLLLLSRNPAQGFQIAFTNRPSGTDHIYVMNQNGANVQRLTNNSGDIGPSAWSFDGTRIAFVVNGNIYRANADGSGQVQLSGTGKYVFPSFSKDGALIYFTRVTTPGPPPEGPILSMNAADASNVQVVFGSDTNSLSADAHVSPDGTTLVFESNVYNSGQGTSNSYPFEIYKCTIGNCINTATRLTSGNSPSPASPVEQVADPNWSPDGTKIVTSYSVISGGVQQAVNVMVMHNDGSNYTTLTSFSCPDEGGDASFSPDGASIAFEWDGGSGSSCAFQNNNSATTHVYTMLANGTNQTDTRQTCSNIGCGPRWQPVSGGASGAVGRL